MSLVDIAEQSAVTEIANIKELMLAYPTAMDEVAIYIPVRPADGIGVALTEVMIKWGILGFRIVLYKDFQGGFIETVRQGMVYKFLRRDKNERFMMMVDNDVTPPVELPFLLMRHNAPMVGAPTMILSSSHGPCWNFTLPDPEGKWRFPSVERQPVMPSKGVIPVGHIGTGAVCIRRDVLESFSWEGEDIPFCVPQSYRLEGAKTGSLRRGEDIQFCVQVREKGYSVLADLEARCGHIKPIVLDWPTDQISDSADPAAWRSHPEEYEIRS